MANLPEASTFDAGVFALQTTDLVLGGIGAPANAGAQNLTNRTRWLFDQNTANLASLAAQSAHLTTHDGQISTLNGNVASINANLASINGQLPLLAPVANPTLTGIPRVPTAAGGTSTTQAASTQFVANAIAPLATTAFVIPGSSLTTNGYRKNADGSIDQWGICNPAGGSLAVTLPIAFVTAAYSAESTGISQPTTSNVTALSTTTITIKNSGGQSYFSATGK